MMVLDFVNFLAFELWVFLRVWFDLKKRVLLYNSDDAVSMLLKQIVGLASVETVDYD